MAQSWWSRRLPGPADEFWPAWPMGHEIHKHGHASSARIFYFWGFLTAVRAPITVPHMEPMTKVWLSKARWEAIKELARHERRSGTAQLNLVLDRGMGGRAGYDLSVMAEQRASRLISPEKSD